MWIIFLLALILGTIYLIFISPIFRIKNISAQGTDKVSGESIVNAVNQYLGGSYFRIISKKNFLFASDKKIAAFLQDNFKELKEITVTKKFPASLAIAATGREKAMTYCGQEKCFYIDGEGIVFDQAPEIYGGINIVLKDYSGRQIKLGDKAIEPSLISFMLKDNQLLLEDLNLSLLNFQIDSYPSIDVRAITAEDWKIIFDINRDPQPQIDALKAILDEKIKDQRNRLDYIDLRVEDRAYYKMK